MLYLSIYMYLISLKTSLNSKMQISLSIAIKSRCCYFKNNKQRNLLIYSSCISSYPKISLNASQLSYIHVNKKELKNFGKTGLKRCFILTHFNYCNLVWHFCGAANSAKLERIQYRALKFVYRDFKASYV